jgi:WD40 repeat protein
MSYDAAATHLREGARRRRSGGGMAIERVKTAHVGARPVRHNVVTLATMVACVVGLGLVACGHLPPLQVPSAPQAVQHETALRFVPQLRHPTPIRGAQTSADGRFAVSFSREAPALVWDVATGALMRSLDSQVQGAAMSSDGRTVATWSTDGTIRAWDWSEGTLVATLAAPAPSAPSAGLIDLPPPHLRLSSNGELLAAAVAKSVRLWDVRSQRAVRDLAVDTTTFRFCGRRLLTAGYDGALTLWDPDTGNPVRTFRGNTKPVTDIQVGHDARGFVTIDADNVASWQPTSDTPEWSTPNVEGSESVVLAQDESAFFVSGKHLAMGSRASGGHTELHAAGSQRLVGATATGEVIAFDTLDVTSSKFDIRSGRADVDARSPLVMGRSGTRRAFGVDVEPLHVLTVSAGGGTLAVANYHSALVWDLASGSVRHSFRMEFPWDNAFTERHALSLSDDGRSLLVAETDNCCGAGHVYDIDRSQPIAEFQGAAPDPDYGSADPGPLGAATLSGDGRQAASMGPTVDKPGILGTPSGVEQALRVWDARSGKVLRQFRTHYDGWGWHPHSTGFGTTDPFVWLSAQGLGVIGGVREQKNVLDVRSLDTGGVLRSVTVPDPISSVAATPDGARILTGHRADGAPGLRLWDGRTLSSSTALDEPQAVSHVAISADGRLGLSVRFVGDEVRLWDLDSGRLVRVLTGHQGHVQDAAFIDDHRAVSIGADGVARVWNLDTGTGVSLVAAGSDWIAYTDDGYFDASLQGTDLVAVVRGDRVFRLDQLAVRYNRPDIVLETMGFASPERLAHYRARHALRLKQLGLREESLATQFDHAPQGTIVDVKAIGKIAEVTFDVVDDTSELASYSVYCDRVPATPAAGKPTSGHRQRLVERVSLGGGTNRIEVAARDTSGSESLHAFRWVGCSTAPSGPCDPKKNVPRLFYLGVGASKFRNHKLDLQFADKDARDVATAIRVGNSDDQVRVKLLLDEEVTRDNIAAAKDFFRDATEDDQAIVFAAGHGVHTRDAAAEYYFATYDVDVARLRETAAPFSMLEGLLTDIAPRYRYMLLDTCESGERDDQGAAGPVAGGGQRRLVSRAVRGLVLDDGTEGKSAPPRKFLYERDRYVYMDLSMRTGATVLSSSRGNEFSYERSDWQNGAFSYELKAGLSTRAADASGDGLVTFHELAAFVGKTVPRLTGDLQHPVIDHDNPDVEIYWELPASH